MSFIETIQRAGELLRRQGRISLRALKLEFDLDDEHIEALVEELVDIQRVAAREGKALAWMGDRGQAEEGIAEPDSGAGTAEAERLQLTVLFCDLVDSTRLAAGMDAEDWREVVRRYQEAAGGVVGEFGGHVAQYLGDGLLVYFGWPRAHEDDAERAVRAGLGIVDAVAAANEAVEERHGLRLALRVSIHTGTVVVGEMGAGSTRETLAMGDATNVAARLQGVAQPGTVVASSTTLRLTPGVFVTRDLGPQTLKGLAAPIRTHQVVQASGVRSRLDLLAATELTPFVGRTAEIALLEERLERVGRGRGQAVLVCGEPGIGKSRLALAFRERLAERPHSWLECRGSPYTQNTSLHPVLELVRQGLGLGSEGSPEAKIAAMEQGLAAVGFDLAETVPLLAYLDGIRPGDRYPAPNLSPEALRKRTLEFLTEWVLRLGQRQPLVLLMEDLHWMDPSTVELLGQVVERIATAPVLLLATYRPEFRPPWIEGPDLVHVDLERFAEAQLRDLIRKAARGRSLPDGWVDPILSRSDGVPLFAEELTRAVLEANPDSGRNDAAPRIPDTLQDLLEARLDRLGPGKELAELGAVLGREFGYGLLLRISPLSEREFQSALAAAVQDGLFYQRGTPPHATLLFRHALIRDAAYASLLRTKRQQHHLRAAETVLADMPEVAEEQPELVAHHLTEANEVERAIAWWHRSGEQAFKRVAIREALAHLDRGVGLLDRVAEEAARARLEVALQATLGRALVVARGYGVDDALNAWERARDLSDFDSDPLGWGLVHYGLMTTVLSRGQSRAALDAIGEVFRAAERSRDPLLAIAGPYARGAIFGCMGQLARSRTDFETACRLFDPREHHFVASGHQEEFGIQSFAWSAWSHQLAGFPDRARAAVERGLDLARQLGHPYTLAFCLMIASWACVIRRDRRAARALATEGVELSKEQNFPLLEGAAGIVVAWADGLDGDASQVMGPFMSAMNLASAAGNQVGVPLILSALVEIQAAGGQPEAALGTVDGALGFAQQTEQHFCDADLRRWKGEIYLHLDDHTEDEAAEEFVGALEVSRSQEAKALELRAATSLARLWRDQGKTADARDLLQPVYDWFTEGFDTQDLKDAKALLKELDPTTATG